MPKWSTIRVNYILASTKKEETKIKAISLLQSIELDLFNIFKQLPEVRVEDNTCNTNDDNHRTIPEIDDDPHMDSAWGTSTRSVYKPRVLDEESFTDEENKIYYDKKMKKYEERISSSVSIETAINAYDQQDVEEANTSSPSTDSMEE